MNIMHRKIDYIKEAAIHRGLDISQYGLNTYVVGKGKGSIYILRKHKDIYEVEFLGRVLFATPHYRMALNYIHIKKNQEL